VAVEHLPDRILAGPEALGELSRDDHRAVPTVDVAPGRVASMDQDAERAEISRLDARGRCARRFLSRRKRPLVAREDERASGEIIEWEIGADSRGGDTGKSGNAREQLMVKC